MVRAIEIRPDLPYLHAWLAQGYAELGNQEGAFEEQKVLAKLDPQLAADVSELLRQKKGGFPAKPGQS